MKRSKHSLSHYHLTTMPMGQLIPVGLTEVLPGDSIQQSTSMLIRVSPLVAPVMHPVVVRIHHWFVPNRVLWDGWEDFITGGDDGMGGNAGAYPTISGTLGQGGLGNHFGLPIAVPLTVSVLPFRAYNLIWNEFYRDQDLQNAVALDSPNVQAVAWEKDYFTSARPWPQKGPEITVPLGSSAPVISDPTGNGAPFFANGQGLNGNLGQSSGSNQVLHTAAAATADGLLYWRDTELIADLQNATGASIDDLRRAFAIQRYQEARARYGSRYTEYLRYLGVRSSDARLQLPEYLGGGKQTISFSEVLQTGPGGTPGSPVPGGVGQLAGHGITAMRSNRYRRFFEEHGYILSLCSVRPRTMYQQGIDRTWSRRTKEDYWQKELEFIGQQEILQKEVYATGVPGGAGDDGVFGYQDRYSEYKHQRNVVTGDFMNELDFWHMGRRFGSAPALNESFVKCDPTLRIYQDTNNDPLWCMVSHNIQARRMVRRGNSSKIF